MNIPVDIEQLNVKAIIEVRPQTTRDGEHRRDFNGVRQWSLVVTCQFGYQYETIEIGWSQDNDPAYDPASGVAPRVTGLKARPWSKIDDYKKLKSGIMWMADTVEFPTGPGAARRPASEPAAV